MASRYAPNTGEGPHASLDQTLYRLLRSHPDWLNEDLAEEAGVSPAEVESSLEQLERLKLVAPSTTAPGGYSAIDPVAAMGRLFAAEERQSALYQQQVTRSRTAIQVIMSDFLRVRAEQSEAVQIETLRTGAQVNAFLDDAVGMVRSHESTMHPGGVPPVHLMDDMLLRDTEVMDRGIQVRTLYARHVADVPYMAEYLAETDRLGMEVRLSTQLPLRMLIFDEDLALLPIDPTDSSQGAFAIRGVELVRSLQTFFDFCWHNAVPLEQVHQEATATVQLSPQEQLIVQMFVAGAKDEAIARQLGVSARTLSRLISGLLDQLGVQTRFQAALRLSDLALIKRD